MHYYKRNIGDYHKKAGRLSILQHGVYCLLIDACYDRETFPTEEQAIDWAWASTDDEISAVKFVLRKFFTEENGHFIQNRIKDDLAKYHANSETNKRIAIERETKRKEESTKRAQAVNEAPPNHKPLTNNHKPDIKGQQVAPIPYEEIVKAYNEHLAGAIGLPSIVKLSNKRKALIKKSFSYGKGTEHESNTIDYWTRYFNHLTTIDFIKPEFSRPEAHKNWKADFEYIMREETWTKVIEGTLSGY